MPGTEFTVQNKMKYLQINQKNPDPKIIKEASRCLDKGGLIVYPTDTLYGLGVDAYNRKAVDKLFEVKKREKHQPVSIMLNSMQQIKEIFGFNPTTIKNDLDKILPGKYTVIINNSYKKKIPILENPEKPGSYLEKVAIRIPANPISGSLAHLFDAPISCTSANISGKENMFTVDDIVSQLGNQIDLVLDAGRLPASQGSTVVDFTCDPYAILRTGDVSKNELQKILDKEIQTVKSKYIITFICSGNICRSPIAEAILKKMISKTKYKSQVMIQSAGTLSIPTSAAHGFAVDICHDADIDLTHHLSRHVNEDFVKNSDIIFCMAQNHISYLVKNYPKYKSKFILLKQWQKPKLVSIPSIADPIGHEKDFFKSTFSEIHSELKRILPALLNEVKVYVAANQKKK
jgi:tRNA threonylcarbamoyl adenosine modification protein (Sua5/YciO/YrdC/YwlC family)